MQLYKQLTPEFRFGCNPHLS